MEIRNAIRDDIERLMSLNQKYQRQNLKSLQHGYIGAAFSRNTFYELIRRNQIAVCIHQTELIGYYLINNYSQDSVIGLHEEMVEN